MLFRKLEKYAYGNSILMVTLSSYFSCEERKQKHNVKKLCGTRNVPHVIDWMNIILWRILRKSIEWLILDESCFCEIQDKPLGVKMVYQGVCAPRNNYNRTPRQHITICTPKMFNSEKQQLSSHFVTIFIFCWNLS